MKANEILDWHVVIHQQRQELAKNVADDEDETEDEIANKRFTISSRLTKRSINFIC